MRISSILSCAVFFTLAQSLAQVLEDSPGGYISADGNHSVDVLAPSDSFTSTNNATGASNTYDYDTTTGRYNSRPPADITVRLVKQEDGTYKTFHVEEVYDEDGNPIGVTETPLSDLIPEACSPSNPCGGAGSDPV